MIERIEHQGRLYAIVVRQNYEPEGVQFVTAPEHPMQLGVLKHPHGTVIKPHVHKISSKTITETHEVLVIQRGKVIAKFYDDGAEFAHVTLNGGDTILLLAGGHGFDIVEDTKMIEVKQGPYYSVEQDKVRLKT